VRVRVGVGVGVRVGVRVRIRVGFSGFMGEGQGCTRQERGTSLVRVVAG
jgi:hypothetical protein